MERGKRNDRTKEMMRQENKSDMIYINIQNNMCNSFWLKKWAPKMHVMKDEKMSKWILISESLRLAKEFKMST